MGVKEVVTMGSLAVMLVACGKKQVAEIVTIAEYQELLVEYQELKEENDLNKQEVINQASVLNKTLQELTSISKHTVSLRGDIESGTARLSQADDIEENIKAVKDKIASYESAMKKSDVLKKSLESLKKLVSEKEAEIAELKVLIASKDDKIEEQTKEIELQKEQIEDKNIIISDKEQELAESLRRQTLLVYNAAVEFEALASQDIDIKNSLFRNNKESVEEYKESILRKAAEYYKAAADMGYKAAESKVEELGYLLY